MMLNNISPKMARLILAAIRPHLAELIDVLEGFEQSGVGQGTDICSPYVDEYERDIDTMCTGTFGNSLYTEQGNSRECFECVMRYYGISNYHPNDSTTGLGFLSSNLSTSEILDRYRAILRGYLEADERIRIFLGDNPCADINFDITDRQLFPSVIDALLGADSLQVRYVGNQLDKARASGTNLIQLPESELSAAQERARRDESDPFSYQSIEFLFTHELGHIFHNRINEIVYDNDRSGVIDGVIVTVPDTPRPVTEFMQFVLREVGGFYTATRIWNPIERTELAVPLTSLNFYGRDQKVEEIYDGNSIRSNVRQDYTNRTIQIHPGSSEFVYAERGDNGEFVAVNEGEGETLIEAGTYVPELRDVRERISHLMAIGQLPETTTAAVFFPNETRETAEPREAFADAFATWIRQPNVLENTKRGEFFDNNMKDWLCSLLAEVSLNGNQQGDLQ